MENRINIYAIIVTYNGMQWIERCLQCLRESSVPITPIVIDNNSSDGTCEYIPTMFPEVIWLPQKKNLGFGQANNIGFQYALQHDAEYVLLLNQDAYLHKDAIHHLIQESDGNSLLSPIHLNGTGDSLDKMFRFLIKENDNTIIDDILTNKGLAPSYRIGRVSAACWFLPISIIKSIGGFNPLFFHYGEDENYLHRLTFHNIPTVLVTMAKVYHDRDIHGNVQVFNRKKLHRDILLIACNININIKTKIIQYLRCLYECYAWNLPLKQYKPLAWTKEILWTIFHYKIISKSRSTEKNEYSSWL